MSDLGLLSYYLGIQVEQKEGVTTLCQNSYALKILEQAGTKGCMENRLKLSKKDDSAPVDATKYRSMMRYLVNTRPDIAYSVGIVSRYMDDHGSSKSKALVSSQANPALHSWYCELWVQL